MKTYLMKKTLFLSLAFNFLIAEAQVPKNVVVEVFTNTRCSTCGAKDPGIYRTIHSYPNLIQIAYYPSAPYANCFFSQQNKSEYDGRTRNYGVYGSTPRVFVQGIEVNNNLDTSDVKPSLNQLSNFEVNVVHTQLSATTATVSATIIKRATDASTTANLYLAVGEDSIVYNAPNGIKTHYGVMRRAMTDSSGMAVQLPATIGDSLVVTKTYTIDGSWEKNLLTGYAFLANATNKSIINANKKKLALGNFTGIAQTSSTPSFAVSPNPATTKLYIQTEENIQRLYIIDLLGKTQEVTATNKNVVDISALRQGVYLVQIEKQNGHSIFIRFVKE